MLGESDMIDPTMVYGLGIIATAAIAAVVLPVCAYLDDTAADRRIRRRHKKAQSRRLRIAAERRRNEAQHIARLRAIYHR